MNKYEDKLQEKIYKKIKKQTNNSSKKPQPHQNSPLNYRPWYQGDNTTLISEENGDFYNTNKEYLNEIHITKDSSINVKTIKDSLTTKQETEEGSAKNSLDKVDANWMQTGCKVDAQLDANWMQTGCKVDAETGAKIANSFETGCKVDAQLDAELDAKWMQSGCKVDAEIVKLSTYASLVGIERAFVFLVYNECQKFRSKITNKLTIEHIQSIIKTKKSSIKSAIRRLEKKGVVKRISFKNGRGGWSIYTISDLLFIELLQNETGCKLDANWMQTRGKVDAQLDAQLDASSVVSSSYIYNNKLLTTTALPEEYKTLDFSCLTNIGFNESHVIQIHREHTKKPELALSPEVIQNSINAFAFDLKHNDISADFKNSPAVVLTSLLKKGQPYSSKTPEKVLTPKEEAMQEYFLAEKKKQQKILELEIKTKELALQEWLNLLPEEELLNFNQDPRPEGMPERLYELSKKRKALEFAKEYFNTVLWPEKLKQILSKVKQEGKLQEQIPT